jgi:hypothetical protein
VAKRGMGGKAEGGWLREGWVTKYNDGWQNRGSVAKRGMGG